MSDIYQNSLQYHSVPRAGKIGLEIIKKCETQEELSLAYTPGVAGPCLEIEKDKTKLYDYTLKKNTVAIVSDGSAVLGLGDIGPEASIPVMEGKCVLFKKFAGIDAFPICLKDVRDKDGKTDSKKVIDAVIKISPVFGGINLEDIAAPACFEIEKELEEKLNIPVFHDDQHGTAIICLAALINSLELTNRKIKNTIIVINGAGAAGIAICDLLIAYGFLKSNITLCDSLGVVFSGRKDGMNKWKKKFALKTKDRTLKDALKGRDVFIGVSKANLLKEEDIKSMNQNSIIFAMANPIPEIMPDLAKKAGAFIVATGRSDFPNQINNVLGFPGIFRGVLDGNFKKITMRMKLNAALALAKLAKKEITGKALEMLKKSYPKDYKKGIFKGKNPLKSDYIIPKPFDPRVVKKVSEAVRERKERGN